MSAGSVTARTARSPGGPPSAGFVPYVYGATLGRPSRGRPESVLAHLKTIGSIRQEDCVADGREGRVTAKGSLPRSPRNGLPEPGRYVYRGSGGRGLSAGEAEALLTGRAPGPRPRRRPARKAPGAAAPALKGEPLEPGILDRLDEQVARLAEARAREQAGLPAPEPAPEAPAPARRHRKCGYPVGSVGCENTCGSA